jgi:hypothetical protein
MVQRELPIEWDKFIEVAKSLEKIEFRDGKPKFVRLVYDLSFDDLDDLKKKFDELRTLPL